MTESGADTTSIPKRLDWIDATRGLSVIAVVLFHVVLWHYSPETASERPPLYKFWQFQNGFMGSVRIPLLLVLSGLLAHGKIMRGFKSPGILISSLANYYIYAVWLLIYAIFFVFTSGALPHRMSNLTSLGRQFVIPDTTLWFVFALALYVPLLGLLHKVPMWAVLGTLTGLAVVMGESEHWAGLWPKIPSNAIFFAIGVYASPWLRRLSSRVRWWHLAPAALAPVFLLFVSGSTSLFIFLDIINLALKVSFVSVAIILMILFCRFSLVTRLGTAIGRNTLPIYVLHALLIYVWIILTDGAAREIVYFAVHTAALSTVYPVIVTIMVVAASLLIHTLAIKFRIGFLFLLPSKLRRRIETRFIRSPQS